MASQDFASDFPPSKRRRLGTLPEEEDSKAWDSQNDSGEDLTAEDYATVATLPLASQMRRLTMPLSAFHSEIDSMTLKGQDVASERSTYVTQPTQPLPTKDSDVLVERSSPPAQPPPKPVFPGRIRSGLLARTLAPPGTAFRQPLGAQAKPPVVPVVDSDEEENDPPVQHSSGDETQDRSSNIKPTNFKKGGRGLDSTPDRVEKQAVDAVEESPHSSTNTFFAKLMGNFSYDQSRPAHPRLADDLVSSYAASRAPRPQQQRMPSKAKPITHVRYKTIDDVEDFATRNRIRQIWTVLPDMSTQRCFDALVKTHNNVENAKIWLIDNEERPSDHDELGSMSPPPKRGVAIAKSQLQPVRPAAKQEVKAPSKSIAEKYAAQTNTARKPSITSKTLQDSDDEDLVQPRRRLLQGRRPRSSSPPSSPPVQKLSQLKQRQKQSIVISDDENQEQSATDGEKSEEAPLSELAFQTRLLDFFNTCTARELAELSAQAESVAQSVLSRRPFSSISQIQSITDAPAETKTGRRSKARPIGDKLVEICSDMLEGYEAVDELVEECEKLAKPIQKALHGWIGTSKATGELELMNIDEAHDSGIGTPSSVRSDDAQQHNSKGKRSSMLSQPASMGEGVELKNYQIVGLNWLNLLWKSRTSCILADDMGLGKTCQVIAFFAHLQEQAVDGVHLVIVPGSTLENWLREFARFAPSLKVFPYYGSDKERPQLRAQIENEFDTIDVIVTTYDVARTVEDNKFLRKEVQPSVCVFDEAHLLRNPYSQRYEQLARIPADFRLLLTGTPLQNNLQELVAILAFIMPDLFQEKRAKLDFIFKAKASTKDANSAALLSAQRIKRARTMMTPFILRRKKAQVLDLPQKLSRVEWCDMTLTQAAFYDQVQSEAQELLTGAGSKASKARAGTNIIMKLRQAAIHPLLQRRLYTDKKIDKIVAELKKHDEYGDAANTPEKIRAYLTGEAKTGQKLQGGDYALHRFCEDRPYLHKYTLKKTEWMDSGKVKKFSDLVTTYARNGDRVLVFSQFTTLMDILEAVLNTLDIKFTRLDGNTAMQERQDLIDLYTSTPDITVFMLSTKAGGAGINLAAANKVIIFDSGFNPQDDIQAENRAHRVGQTRDVEVVRLVVRGTIEEQIHALGESKLALDERVSGEVVEDGGKAAEKQGEALVKEMLVKRLQETGGQEKSSAGGDLRDMFKEGLEKEGHKVASKQAVF